MSHNLPGQNSIVVKYTIYLIRVPTKTRPKYQWCLCTYWRECDRLHSMASVSSSKTSLCLLNCHTITVRWTVRYLCRHTANLVLWKTGLKRSESCPAGTTFSAADSEIILQVTVSVKKGTAEDWIPWNDIIYTPTKCITSRSKWHNNPPILLGHGSLGVEHGREPNSCGTVNPVNKELVP